MIDLPAFVAPYFAENPASAQAVEDRVVAAVAQQVGRSLTAWERGRVGYEVAIQWNRRQQQEVPSFAGGVQCRFGD